MSLFIEIKTTIRQVNDVFDTQHKYVFTYVILIIEYIQHKINDSVLIEHAIVMSRFYWDVSRMRLTVISAIGSMSDLLTLTLILKTRDKKPVTIHDKMFMTHGTRIGQIKRSGRDAWRQTLP